jgi:hypothetical protein
MEADFGRARVMEQGVDIGERSCARLPAFMCLPACACPPTCLPAGVPTAPPWLLPHAVDKLQEAIDTCPVSCIHWVTAPQLTLLEESMARMERVSPAPAHLAPAPPLPLLAWPLPAVPALGGSAAASGVAVADRARDLGERRRRPLSAATAPPPPRT